MSEVKPAIKQDESKAFLEGNDMELKIVKNSQKTDTEIETTVVVSKEVNNDDNESNTFLNKNNIQLKIQEKTDKNVNTKSNDDDDYDCYENHALCISCIICLLCNFLCGMYVTYTKQIM